MRTLTHKLTAAFHTALDIAHLVWSPREARSFTIDVERRSADGITVRIVTPFWARVLVRNGIDQLEST